MIDSKSLPTKRKGTLKLNAKLSDDKETTTTGSVSAESTTLVGTPKGTTTAAVAAAIAPQDNPTLPSPNQKQGSILKGKNESIDQYNGEASENPHQDLIRVLEMVAMERHLTAHELHRQVLSRIRNENQQKIESKEYKANLKLARKFYEENKKQFDNLEKRAKLFTRAKRNLAIDDDWTKAQTLFGITTYYRREADKTLSIKIEGILYDVPLFEQLAVLKEIDLYHTWAPFCSSSDCVATLTKCDTIGHVMCGLPSFGLYRDACFRALACDSMNEDGSIIIVAESVGQIDSQSNQQSAIIPETPPEEYIDDDADDVLDDQKKTENSASEASSQNRDKKLDKESSQERRNVNPRSLSSYSSTWTLEANDDDDDDENLPNSFLSEDEAIKDIPLPPPPTGYGAARMHIRRFEAEIDVLSPTSARTRLISNVDPNIALPKWLLDFILKKMCGVLLNRLQSAAKRTLKDPSSPHARRMRENSEFYRQWLWHRFKKYCDELGWEMPTVQAFEAKEEKLDADKRMKYDSQNVKSRSVITGDFDSVASSFPDTPSTLSQQSTISSKSSQSTKHGWFPLSPKREQRVEKLRIRKIATARRKAQILMRPKKKTPAQERRLQVLKEAKLRFEGKIDADDFYDDVGSTDSESVSTSRSSYSRDSTRSKSLNTFTRPSKLQIFFTILSGGHPKILPYMTLPFILSFTIFVLYTYSKGVNHLLLQRYEKKSVAIEQYLNQTDIAIMDILSASSVEVTNSKFTSNELLLIKLFPCIVIMIIAVYNFLFWCIACSTLVWAYDAIEIPGLVGEYKTQMTNVRKFYVQKMQAYTLYGSLTITAISFARAIAVDAIRRLSHPSIFYWEVGTLQLNSWMITMKDSVDIFNFHLPQSNYAPVSLLDNSSIMYLWEFCGKHGRILTGKNLKHMTRMGNTLMQYHWVAFCVNLVSVSSRYILYGCRQLLNLIQFLLYSQTETLHKPWIINAIDFTKFSLAYITAFLFTALICSLILGPKRQRPKRSPSKRTSRMPTVLPPIPETSERSDNEVPKMIASGDISAWSTEEVKATGNSHDVDDVSSIDDAVKSAPHKRGWKRKITKKMKLKIKNTKATDTNESTNNGELVSSAVILDYRDDQLDHISTQESMNSLCSDLTEDTFQGNQKKVKNL